MDLMNATIIKDKAGNDTEDYMTPKGIILYESLMEAQLMKGEKDPEKARYNVTLLFPKTAGLKAIQEAVIETATEKIGKKIAETKWRKPWIKMTADDHPKEWNRLVKAGLNPADYPVMVRLASKAAPSVRLPSGMKTEDEEQVYEGRWARASVRPYFYDHPTGGKGVSLGLGNVQLLDHADPLPRGGGGQGGDEFEAVSEDGGKPASADNLFDD